MNVLQLFRYPKHMKSNISRLKNFFAKIFEPNTNLIKGVIFGIQRPKKVAQTDG